ncbi:MAG TPA: VOC family protein [Gaiellales bacterium]|jgi:catechol 2,3-dioxygenase
MNTTHTSLTPGQEQALPTPTLRLGPAHLTVTDLDRSVAFYERSIGLRVRTRDAATATLWAGGSDDLLVLAAEPAARRAGRHAGLYHVALLHPSRLELARAAARLADTRTPIIGASDHGISEAIYLPDPDGSEIELAADRPRDVWPDLRSPGWDGDPTPLDLNALLDLVAAEPVQPNADPGLTVGHVHLHVGDVDRAVAFYRDVLGFEVMTRLPTAAFMAADGYHHHVAVNVWRGVGVPPAPPATVGLRHWTIVFETPQALAETLARIERAGIPAEPSEAGVLVHDPWDIAVLLTARTDN